MSVSARVRFLALVCDCIVVAVLLGRGTVVSRSEVFCRSICWRRVMLESPALNLAIVVVWLDGGRETIVFVGPSSVLSDSEFDLDLPPRYALCPSVDTISCCAPAVFCSLCLFLSCASA